MLSVDLVVVPFKKKCWTKSGQTCFYEVRDREIAAAINKEDTVGYLRPDQNVIQDFGRSVGQESARGPCYVKACIYGPIRATQNEQCGWFPYL